MAWCQHELSVWPLVARLEVAVARKEPQPIQQALEPLQEALETLEDVEEALTAAVAIHEALRALDAPEADRRAALERALG